MGQSSDEFQEQVRVSMGGGLALPDRSTNLETIGTFDPAALGDFAGPKVAVESMSTKFQAQGEEGLVSSDDLNRLDAGLQRIQAAQQDRKLAALMERVQALINEGNFKEAVGLLDDALEDAPGVAALYMMKAHCLMQLDDYDEALDALNLAEGVSADLETALFVAIMLRACTRRLASEAEREIIALVQADKTEEALSFVQRKLRQMPETSVLIFHRSTLLLLLGRVGEAKRSALEGLQGGTESEKPLFAQLLKQIGVLESLPFLEMARQAFRGGNPAGAFKMLESRRPSLQGNEQFEVFHAYLLEKTLGAFGRMFHPGAKKLLTGETLETFLLWLLSEEISAGVDLMNKERFEEAVTLFKNTQKLESRCRLIRFLHAVAKVKKFQAAMSAHSAPDLDKSSAELREAAELCEGLGDDQRIGSQSNTLKDVASGYVKQIADAKVQIREKQQAAKPVQSLIKEFNSYMEGLNKHPISSIGQLNGAESRLKAMRSKVGAKRREITDSDARSSLSELETAISKVLSQLDDARHGRGSRPSSSSSLSSSSDLTSFDSSPDPNFCGPMTEQVTAHLLKMVQYKSEHPMMAYWESQELDEMRTEMRSLVRQAMAQTSNSRQREILRTTLEWVEKM
jgi:tetratricopeptide (TPR) repeat protein